MDSQKNISLVFGIIILLLIGLGASSLFYLNTIASEAENIYRHPYAVSNAARNINIGLVSIHRCMQDIVLAEDTQQIEKITRQIDRHEQNVLKNFDVIFDRYLGRRSDIQSVYNAFINWKTIRDEVIALKRNHHKKDAANITQNRGAAHIALLNKETQKLIDFADNKARLFLNNAISTKRHALAVITALLLITVAASIAIACYSVRRLRMAQLDMKSRIHLIDQNVLMAKFDTSGVVLDISNKLCRYLGLTKDEIIGKQANFFIPDNQHEIRPETILKTTSTGKTWEGEIRIEDAAGMRWIHSAIYPELDENYRVSGYTNIIQDITDRKAIEELSITDALTRLYNRRHFDRIIEKEIKIARRNGTTLTFAIADIDYFKRYNDHYGHPAGDSALVKVAQVLKQSLNRPNDYAFRVGGEEFGLLFSNLDAKAALHLLETIRQRVEDLHIAHCKSDVHQYVTISIGAYSSRGNNILDSSQLYVKADEALYQAKRQRNHVVIA